MTVIQICPKMRACCSLARRAPVAVLATSVSNGGFSKAGMVPNATPAAVESTAASTQGAPVHTCLEQMRDYRRGKGDEDMHNAVCESTRRCTAEQREQQTFREPLLKQANPSRTKRRTHRQSMPPSHAVGQHQTGYICGGNQQHRQSRNEQQPSRQPDIMNLQISDRAHLQAQHLAEGWRVDSTKL